MKKLLLISLVSIAALFPGRAQEIEEYCGTPPGVVEWLQDFQANPAAFLRSPGLLNVPVAIHIVGDDAGEGHFPISRILNAFCSLNEDFEASNIQFFIEGGFHYINNSEYYGHNYGKGIEMMERNNVPDAVNCYFVNDPAGSCGYTLYNLGIALNKGCTTAGSHTWAHEIGHFLSLPHTFAGWEDVNCFDYEQAPASINGKPVEQVNRSNCQSAGDGFCDTPPDYISTRWGCRPDGMSNALLRDPAGTAFRPDGTLIMSYSTDDCAGRFSEAQTEAMRANLLNQRPNLLYNQEDGIFLEGADITSVSPIDGAVITDVSSLTLEWEPVGNADGYIVQLNLLSNIGLEIVYQTFHTTGNKAEISNLISDRDWLWRVRPYNRYDGCAGYSNSFTFETGNFINTTREEVALTDFHIQPNPQDAGGDVAVKFDLPIALELQLSLYSMAGQRIHTERLNAHYGLNTAVLSTDNLEPGLYLIGLEHAQGRQFRKIVIQ